MTKFGIEMPVIETAMTPWSTAEFWRNAAMEPAVTPNSTATTIAQAPSVSDTGNPAVMSSVTV